MGGSRLITGVARRQTNPTIIPNRLLECNKLARPPPLTNQRRRQTCTIFHALRLFTHTGWHTHNPIYTKSHTYTRTHTKTHTHANTQPNNAADKHNMLGCAGWFVKTMQTDAHNHAWNTARMQPGGSSHTNYALSASHKRANTEKIVRTSLWLLIGWSTLASPPLDERSLLALHDTH